MNQNRKRDDDMPTRSSNMEPAEGSRETIRDSGNDLGSSSDRAMFDERVSERPEKSNDGRSSGDGRMGSTQSERGSSNSGGITNRPLDREASEQQQLPERGRSKSER